MERNPRNTEKLKTPDFHLKETSKNSFKTLCESYLSRIKYLKFTFVIDTKVVALQGVPSSH